MEHARGRPRADAGFTLIELLVVVADGDAAGGIDVDCGDYSNATVFP